MKEMGYAHLAYFPRVATEGLFPASRTGAGTVSVGRFGECAIASVHGRVQRKPAMCGGGPARPGGGRQGQRQGSEVEFTVLS